MKKGLQEIYNEWRKEIEENNKFQDEVNGTCYGSWDCGEGIVREDFSNAAELEEEISFEEMLKLESNYEE